MAEPFVPPDAPDEPESAFVPPDLPDDALSQSAADQFVARFLNFPPTFRQGVTFGFADEGEAAIRALWDRDPEEDYTDAYFRIRDRKRAELEQFRQARPTTSLLTEMAGGLASGGIGSSRAVLGGATAGGRILRGAGTGAGFGAVVGTGQAEEIEDVPREAAIGAGAGAAVGAAIPAAAEGVRRGVSAVRGVISPEAAATRRISQAIGRDEMTPQQLANALEEARRLGRPATVADIGDEAIRRELEVAAQSPGPAGSIARRFLSERNKKQLQRLTQDLVEGTDVEARTVLEAIDRTKSARASAAAPVYERAMSFSAEQSDDIVEAWRNAIKTPLGKDGLRNARKTLNLENFDEAPLMEKIDAWKKGMDDVIDQALQRDRKRQIARKALELKNEVIGLVDTVNPDYRQARQIWEGESRYLDAINRGREILAPKFTAAGVAREFADLTDAEQEAFRIGAVDTIVTRMRTNSAKEPNLIKLVRSPEIRDKLKAIMKPDQAERLDDILDIEDSMFSVASQALRGSQTAQRQAAQAEQAKQVGIVALAEELSALVITPARNLIVQKIPGLSRAMRDRLLARQNAIIARRLLSEEPAELLTIPQARPPQFTGGAAIPPAVLETTPVAVGEIGGTE